MTYTGSAQTICSAKATGVGGLDQTLTVSYADHTDAGAATASASFAADANHEASSGSATFTIGKAGSTTTVSCPTSTVYDGSAQTLCTVTVTGAGGLSTTPTPIYTNNTNVGTATASYTYAGNANHDGSSDSDTFEITDGTAPVVTVPSSITREATSGAGAAVTFTVTASDDQDPSLTASCIPASGSTFALGTHTVNCSSTDSGGNTGTASFSVTVVDTTPPVISNVPANKTVDATGPSGAVVTYTLPTAVDLVNGAVTPVCVPASGSTLAIGTQTVTCMATDSRSNASTASFAVTVRSASQQLASLLTRVTALGLGNSFAAKVQAAQSALASGNAAQAASQLRALINEANAQSGKKLTAAQAAEIIAAAQKIRAVLGH